MPKKVIKTVNIGGVDLDKFRGKTNEYVPQVGADIWYPSDQVKALAVAVKQNISGLLIGETGTGKTSILRDIAFKRGQPYMRINLHGFSSPDELIGSKSAQGGSTYFEKGAVVKAMEMGALLVVDELNAATPDTMFIFHALLDDERKITLPTGEVVKPHPEFRFFATMNPEYEGTRSINRAFLDRFGVVLYIEPMSPDLEKKYLLSQGITDLDADNMILFAGMMRKAYSESKTMTFVSTRSLLQWGEMVQNGFELPTAFTHTVLGKSRKDERQAIADIFEASVGKNLELVKSGDKMVIVKTSDLEKQTEVMKSMEQTIKNIDNIANENTTLKQEIAKLKAETTKVNTTEIDTLKKKLASYESIRKILEETK